MPTPAQKEDVKQYFVTHMMAAFGPPFHIKSNPSAIEDLLTEYIAALAGYGPVVLDDAWKGIRDTYGGKPGEKSWPAIAACVKACRAAKDREWAAKQPVRVSPYSEADAAPPSAILSPERLAEHQRMMADLENKPGGLAATCRKAGRRILDRHWAEVERDVGTIIDAG